MGKCICRAGFTGVKCQDREMMPREGDDCGGCQNGGTCSSGRCHCRPGYMGHNCQEPVCKEDCLNGGRCIAPDRCACVYGYTGRRCEADYRTGPCFTKVSNGLCGGQLPGVVCTKNLCCATVGAAWGHPCEPCPHNLPCEDGHLKNIHSGQCVDINECDAIPGLCLGGECVNTIGSFICKCPKGQARDEVTNMCRDIDECAEQGVCDNGYCVNTDGSYYCTCHPGFIRNTEMTGCIDTRQDECYPDLVGGQCYTSLPIRLSKKDCCCGMGMGKAWGRQCELCPMSGEDEYSQLCNDIIDSGNACAFRPTICGGGRCQPTPGGYECICFPGYTKVIKGQSQVCEDVNECAQGFCLGGNCINSNGSFVCHCSEGYHVSSDGTKCIDYDECQQNGMCANGQCINMAGSFKCQCKPGFVLSSTGHACIDIDECYENPRICLNGRCENTPGSYQCLCLSGYTLSQDRAFCSDIDECANPQTCQNGRCYNMEGTYKCLCDSGYKLSSDEKSCHDIDECSSQNPPCQNGRCLNTIGSFRCTCQSGYSVSLDGRSCLDMQKDVCYLYDNGQCREPSLAVVTKSTCCCCTSSSFMFAWGSPCNPCPMPGSHEFSRLCPSGPGMTPEDKDINECALSPALCANGACENMKGGYRCVCNKGYEPDSTWKKCVDIDECKADESTCDGGQCRNTPGSFQCICPPGTRENVLNHVCDDIDECSENQDACYNGDCINTVGSYECACPPGSVIDHTGRVCIDNRKGSCWTRLVAGRCENSLPGVTLQSECCCSIGVAWGSPCQMCHHTDCPCPRGFTKTDGKTCTDINECSLNAGVCRGGGTCVNTEGSFTCVCPPGLTLDSAGTMCIDVRQESCFSEFKHGMGSGVIEGLYPKSLCCCTRVGKAWGGSPNGQQCEACPKQNSVTFTELCPKGPGMIDRKDINECIEFPGMCANGRCRNMVGGFSCRCNQGYTLDENGIKCVDIDECNIMHGACGNGTCQNLPGSFTCNCKEGFENSEIMQVCVDINECEKIPGLCRGGTCKNTPGSFTCICPPGHELAPDKKSCKDIDECSRTSGICSNGVCENMMGTYQCVCDDGYEHAGIKSHCEDIDECDSSNGGCQSICLNTPGSYLCDCQRGFVLSLDSRSCMDIDECKENPRICNGGKCRNTIGSFTCECTKGLLQGPDGSSCVDIDECAQDKNICGNGECDNTVGSYLCHCEPGYSVKPNQSSLCTDDDECELCNNNCDVNAHCINNPGSYSCRCKDGFTGDGTSCQDINECLNNNGGCNQNAQCVNNDGSFKCVCDSGFRGDGYMCTDVDECAENPMLCANGHCLNYPGSFRCECEMGFMHPNDNSETACVDINECQMFTNLCVYGECKNIFGMFRCECKEGFQLDNTGGNCTDKNECDSPQACQYGICKNTIGSYICTCPDNYQLVPAGNACVDKRESRCYLNVEPLPGRGPRCSKETGGPMTKATCCCSLGKAWGLSCELCPEQDSKEYKDLCPGGTGYSPNVVTVGLEDINECVEHDNLCKNGHCTNTFGSYMCSCSDGFRLSNTTAICVDIDECNENIHTCGPVGFCVNEEGSFHCICPDHYMLLPNGKGCVDMRMEQCYTNIQGSECTHPMMMKQTRMLCCCSMGAAWGTPCQKCPTPGSRQYIDLCGHGDLVDPMTNKTIFIDECSMMPTLCTNGKCMNTPGSFECICNRGFSYDQESHLCIDENECLRSPSPCRGNSECVNSQGSFHCLCPDGYKLGVSYRDCVDVDECIEKPGVCAHGSCKNFQGSFQCVCPSGYSLSTNRDACVDINECARHPNICNNGTCSNSEGSFSCACHPGFKLSHNNDCIDVDECHVMPLLCKNGRCRNTVGSFKCECFEGYTLAPDQQYCRDINECSETDDVCLPPGRCQNTIGSFICSCPPGYRLSPDRKSCVDIDECLERKGICEGGICNNTIGGMICHCPEGFILSDTGMKCIDMRKNLCYDTLEYLEDHGYCSNPRMKTITMKECCCSMGMGWGIGCLPCPQEGTDEFLQLCPQGPGREDTGHDLDECAIMPNACSGGDCINTDGSFRCECPSGYILDSTGKNCIDDNECLHSNNICGNGTCTNVEGSFECSCNFGFTPGPMQSCEDINECQELSNQCAFRCHNVPGSFRCICPYGYTLAPDGRHCRDVDECLTPANNCKFQCKNMIGSFTCICPEGYATVEMSDDCQDIDECSTTPDICQNGRCINTEGSYKCDCYPGFKRSPDGSRCLDERVGNCFRSYLSGQCGTELSEKQVTRADCCCTMGAAWGPMCEPCPPPHSLNYTSLCLEAGINIDGQDIDECKALPDLCKNGRCINSLGSYKCICNKGYKLDYTGTNCRDINECYNRPSPCKFHCHNTDGSYRCSCPNGYKLAPDGITCFDVDECATRQHTCQHICTNTVGSYSCSCPPGYRQEGDHCLDIDECANGVGVCIPPGKCLNTLGSYRCICPRGYKMDKANNYCKDEDECTDDTKCQHGCENMLGSFRCNCPEGYIRHLYYNKCIDDNECMKNPCGQANCVNTVGSYQCACPENYQFDEANMICVQMNSACIGSPCSFGCTPKTNGDGFTCGCPNGYQQIGQGHCLATINPVSNFGVSSIPSLITQQGLYHIPSDKVISTEGCFSCKTNGRQRRMTNGTIPYWMNGIKPKGFKKHKNGTRQKRHHGGKQANANQIMQLTELSRADWEYKVLRLTKLQTRHRKRILEIQPTVKGNYIYKILRGNERGHFELEKHSRAWALHFKKRHNNASVFNLEIVGLPISPKLPSPPVTQPIVLRVRIVVV
nr:fibrillin-2 [Halyomorpha halys]